MTDIDIAVADSLKVLDLKQPIREADVGAFDSDVCYGPQAEVLTCPLHVRTAAKPATRETPDDDDARRARKAAANRITAMLKAALNRAFYADWISSDGVWRKIRPFKRVDEAVVRYLSIPEARRLVDACPDDFRNLVEAALYTGCRYAELTRLRYED